MIALLAASWGAAAHGKELTLARALNQVTAGQTLTVGADWIEPVKGEFSLGLVLANLASDRALVVAHRDLRCSQGGVAGSTGSSDKVHTLGPGETRSVTVVCELPAGTTGDYEIDVFKVYDDPGRTNQPTDLVLFEHVRWSISEAATDKKLQKVPAGFTPKVTDHAVPGPALPLGVPPPKPNLVDQVRGALDGDGQPKPFEVQTREYTLARAKNQVVVGGGAMTIGADLVHPQDDHYTVALALVNNTDEGLAIPQAEIQCRRGATQATLDYAAFGVGKGAITLAPGQVRVLTMKCETGKLATGAFSVTLGRVFSDPKGAGAVDGAVRLSGATWTLEEAGLDPALQQP